jgi:hypothetical protein
MVYLSMVVRTPAVIIKALHESEENPYASWSAAACIQEVERLRQEYIHWKYPDAEPRLQRNITIIQR